VKSMMTVKDATQHAYPYWRRLGRGSSGQSVEKQSRKCHSVGRGVTAVLACGMHFHLPYRIPVTHSKVLLQVPGVSMPSCLHEHVMVCL
jgi:hypothetical protein